MTLHDPRFEIVPIRSVDGQLSALPDGATVAVTSSPRFGITRTLEYVELLAPRGYSVVPHVSARQIADGNQLNELVSRFIEMGVRDLFVIGGDDVTPTGQFRCSYDLLSELRRTDVRIERIGIACYPEGHPLIDDATLLKELLRKQEYADYLVSQMCFDAATTLAWIRRVRSAGVVLPLYLGVPGVVRRARLLELSFRLGVGTSLRFVSKQRALGRRIFRPNFFRPDELLEGIGDAPSDPQLGIAGYHFFTFNEVAQTVRWMQRRRDTAAGSEGNAVS